jgi:nicotinamide mononucleotide transporter
LVQVSLYVFIFYEAKLYSDMILHIIYIFVQILGWYSWMYGGKERSNLKVSVSGKDIPYWILTVFLGTALWGYLMAWFTDAALPYYDAFTTVASLVAQWLMVKKKVESWHFWIIVDIVAIGVYWTKALYLTTGLYAIFLILSVIGLLEWRAAWRREAVLTT